MRRPASCSFTWTGGAQRQRHFRRRDKTSSFYLIGALSVVAEDGTTFTGANYFNGDLDEVRIYNQVLGYANDIAGLALIPPVPTLTSAAAASGSIVKLA